jgi:hypothetical protein
VRGHAEGDSELELWGVARRAELMQEVFGVPVRIDVVPAGANDAPGARRA